MVHVKLWKAEVLAALFLGAVGAYFLGASLRLPPPEEAGIPGPGSAPMILGGFITAGALVLVINALRTRGDETVELGNWKPAFGLASLIIGALIFEPAGFLLSTFLFLTAGFVALGEADWRRAAPAAALISVILWLVFTKLLGVGLPYGLISEALFR